jgi:TRAP-type C4-dicarboxylate transport system permease small subunit
MGSRVARCLGKGQSFTVSVSAVLEAIGLAALAAIVLVTVVDVVGDKAFGWPVAGNTEIIGLLQVVAISSGVAYSKVDGKQIYVGILADTLHGRARAALSILTSLVVLAFWAIACWRLFNYGFVLSDRGTGTFILGIPHYPFVFWTAVCSGLVMTVLVILDALDAIVSLAKGGERQSWTR